jgi:hypothetical protein
MLHNVEYMNMNITLPKPEPKKDSLLNVPIAGELKQEQRGVSRATGLSMSEIVRRWVAYGVHQAARAAEHEEQSA